MLHSRLRLSHDFKAWHHLCLNAVVYERWDKPAWMFYTTIKHVELLRLGFTALFVCHKGCYVPLQSNHTVHSVLAAKAKTQEEYTKMHVHN